MKLNIVLIGAVFAMISIVGADVSENRERRGLAGGVRQLDENELKEEETALSASLSKLDTGDGPSYTISKVHSGTRQTVAGTLSKLDVDLIDGKTGKKERCIVSLWSRPWLPENGYELTVECEDKPKTVLRHSRSVDKDAARSGGIIGGKRPLRDDEIEEQTTIFAESLKKVAAGDGPSYSLSKIISGTSQSVGGSLVEVKAELIDTKTGEQKHCDLSLLSQPWLKENGYEITVKCGNTIESKHRYSL